MSENEIAVSETTVPTDQDKQSENQPKKRIRHRKKLLYEKLLKQMEFYFSDANLSKDRFLGDLVKADPYVPLDTFLKFNKVRALTQDVIDIAKALKHSSFLELSEDKLKVKRKTELQPYDADSRTIYVESIPVTASQEWLERVFSEYGPVAYISLPKFKNSQRLKGFGFIEFGKSEDAQKCLNTFTKMGCKLPTSMPPEELSSVKTFSVEDQSEEAKEETEDSEPPRKKHRRSKEKKLHKSMDLKLEQIEISSDKKLVTPSDENKTLLSDTDGGKTTDAELKDESVSQDEGKKTEGNAKKKKLKKRAAKEKTNCQKLKTKDSSNGALWGLQVLSKPEWKSLRNKYLNLQRKCMSEIKANLRNQRYMYSSIPAPAEPSVEPEPETDSQGEAETEKSAAPLERIPGVFVKETLPEPCLDVRLTKRTIRSNVHALHVEVKEGQTEIFIRFDSAKAADEYCSGSLSARVLSGAHEAEQWARAEAARGARRPRGRARVLRRLHAAHAHPALPALPAQPQPTHTHIRFDD